MCYLNLFVVVGGVPLPEPPLEGPDVDGGCVLGPPDGPLLPHLDPAIATIDLLWYSSTRCAKNVNKHHTKGKLAAEIIFKTNLELHWQHYWQERYHFHG